VAAAPIDIEVRGGTIRLGQFLQLAGLVDTGADAKALVADGAVRVDGEVDTRRGRQLHGGEVVEVGGARARVVPAG
jgi:ribosome-associated protein